jgi:plastocyanin
LHGTRLDFGAPSLRSAPKSPEIRFVKLLLSLFLSLVPAAGWAAEISGTIDLASSQRGPSRRAAVRYAGQTGASAARPAPPRAVVYLSGSFSEEQLAAARKARGPAIVGQKSFRFQPDILAVIRGTTIAFPNRDDDYHNIFSYSKAKRFDLGRYLPTEDAPTVTFDNAGPVRLFCEIHSHMRGLVLVLETPYFTTTNASGEFRLTGLPAGDYELVAWLSERVQHRQKITLTANSKLKIELPDS